MRLEFLTPIKQCGRDHWLSFRLYVGTGLLGWGTGGRRFLFRIIKMMEREFLP
jgi:hypothetical protein